MKIREKLIIVSLFLPENLFSGYGFCITFAQKTMRILFIYCDLFEYRPARKTLDDFETVETGKTFRDIQTAFIHVEEEDEENEASVIKKLVKNIKWICGKNGKKEVVLHSFAHLSNSKAEPAFTKSLFDKVEERLKNAGYSVAQTPFGYFLDLKVEAPGVSLARVYKEI